MLAGIGYGWFNVGSLFLGLIAWILPTINLIKYNKGGTENWVVYSFLSLSASSISVWFQVIFNNHWVRLEDFSALMDTSGVSSWASGILVIVTILLNFMCLSLYKKNHKSHEKK